MAEPHFCPGPPLPQWTRPPLGLSAAGWTALLDTRRIEARTWTDWLHQSAWAREPPPVGVIGALPPTAYAQWEPDFDLVRGTIRFPFDLLPRSCVSHVDTHAFRTSSVRGRFPYTPCGPRVTADQARCYDDLFGRDTLPEDDPVFHPVEPTGSESYWLAQFADYDTERAISGCDPPTMHPRFLRSDCFSDGDSPHRRGERGFERHVHGLLNCEVAICDHVGVALRHEDGSPVGFISAMTRWNGSDPTVNPVDEWIPHGWFADSDEIGSHLYAPTRVIHRLAVSEGRFPCFDDGGLFRPHSDVSDEEEAAMRFGDWCLPIETPALDPHLYPPCAPPFATRSCRRPEPPTAGDQPGGSPWEQGEVDVDVLRSSPVVIDEAFFAVCDQADCTTPGTMWFGVNRSRYGEEPFISQRWDEVMHLVSNWDPTNGRRHFLDGVRFKGGFKRARQAWRYATLLVDERTPFPPSLTTYLRCVATRAAPVRYYAIRIGTHPATGACFERYITADESIYRALRTDSRSVGARFDTFEAACAYMHLEPRDVPPSVVYPEFQVALGPNNSWLDFHANRLWEYRTAWGNRYSLTADINAVAEGSDPAGLSSELLLFEAYLAARTERDRSVGHTPEARTPQHSQQAPASLPRSVTWSYHCAAESRRLQCCGDYRCPPDKGPVLTRPPDSGWWRGDIPWYNSGPYGLPLDLSVQVAMEHDFHDEDQISLYQAQFGNDFIDWETAVLERADGPRRRLAAAFGIPFRVGSAQGRSIWTPTSDY